MSEDSDGESEWEEHPYFSGPCACPPGCPARDNPGAHGWGSCGEPGCPCEAGWEE